MTRREHPLRLVASALQGRLPDGSEWSSLLEIANRGWLTPALYVAFERKDCLGQIPGGVRDYLALLHDRNAERNRRLRAQLIEALRAMNAVGIEPILLKGAIKLFCGDGASIRSRMISDLDINIAPDQVSDVKKALSQLGYGETDNPRELGRSEDVGVIELHDRPNVRSARYLTGDFGTSAPAVEREGVKARVPSQTAQATHLIVHDMIKEGDYWRLGINLRHLHDLAHLERSTDGIDWHRIATILCDDLGKGALAMQLLALHDLFGLETPIQLRGGPIGRLRHKARLQAVELNTTGSLIRMSGKLAWGFHRFRESYTWQGWRDLTRRVHLRLVSSTKGSTIG